MKITRIPEFCKYQQNLYNVTIGLFAKNAESKAKIYSTLQQIYFLF